MYSRQRRPVLYRQKGGNYYQNGLNPNQQGGEYYQNGLDPNQEGGYYYQNGLNPNQQGGFRQFGGARTKGALLRQNEARLRLYGRTPLRRPGTGGKVVKKTRNLNNMFNSLSPVASASPNDSPEYTLSDFSPVHRKGVKKRGPGGKRKRRATTDNHNLLMVKQFKTANPSVRVNDLHALSGGWKLHGSKLGEERKGYRPACMRMAALLGEKMYSSPNSPWMIKMKNGEPLDLLEECNKLRRNPMTTSTNATTAAAAAAVADVAPKAVRRSSRKRQPRVMFGEGGDGARNQKGGFLPLLPLLTMAAPALAKLVT